MSGLKRPEHQRIGDDFLYTYGVQGIRLELSAITDSRREGFHAQVVVRANVGKLSWGRLKLDSWETPTGERRQRVIVHLETFAPIGMGSRPPRFSPPSPPPGSGQKSF